MTDVTALWPSECTISVDVYKPLDAHLNGRRFYWRRAVLVRNVRVRTNLGFFYPPYFMRVRKVRRYELRLISFPAPGRICRVRGHLARSLARLSPCSAKVIFSIILAVFHLHT